jgi:hypothetical protein
MVFMLLFIFPGISKAADGTMDQSNETVGTDGSLAIKAHQNIGQSFTPTMNQLTMVVVYIQNASGTLDISIRQGESGTVLTQMLAQPVINGWNSYDISNINVTPGQLYSIYLDSSDFNPQWSYKDSNTYSNGRAFWSDTADDSTDFGFETFGLNSSTPSGGTTPSDNSTIQAPTNLQAVNLPANNASQVKISWTKSTSTNIDGYKIYRKISGKDYEKIDQVDKNTYSYLDKNVVNGKEYIYMVRSYFGTVESEDSTTATITASANKKIYTAPAVSLNFNNISWTDPIMIIFYCVAGAAIIGFTIWFFIDRKKRKKILEEKKEEKK